MTCRGSKRTSPQLNASSPFEIQITFQVFPWSSNDASAIDARSMSTKSTRSTEEEERVNSRKLAMERRGWIDSKRERTKCLHCIRQLKSRVHPITRSRVSPCICFGAQKTKIRHGKEVAVVVSTGKSISPRYSSGVCRLVTAFFAAHPANGGV